MNGPEMTAPNNQRMLELSITEPPNVSDMKRNYLKSLVAPLDGMWDVGFIDSSPHWMINIDGQTAGYYAANDQGTLLQFFVKSEFEPVSHWIFDQVIAQDSITQAVAFTIDPPFLSFCLDVQASVKVQTFLYQLGADECRIASKEPLSDGMEFRLLKESELDECVAFQQLCLPDGHDLSGWLHGYSSNLIERKELFVLCHNDDWHGLGECRKSESQEGVIDVGMMVDPTCRGKGFGTKILGLLCDIVESANGQAICSTTVENVGAQKAIVRAGFVGRHRILDVSFD